MKKVTSRINSNRVFSTFAVAALVAAVPAASFAQDGHSHSHSHAEGAAKAPKAATPTAPTPAVLRQAAPIPFLQAPSGVARADCFPVERLSPEKRRQAEELLLKICDGEALYTLVGGIKLMSTDWLLEDFDLDNPDAVRLDNAREVLSVLRCGDEISAHMLRFSHAHGGKQRFKAALFNRPALAQEINRHADFWQARAITPHTEPVEVLMNNESEDTDTFERVRANGYLYGYPQQAVSDYVELIRKKFADPKRLPVPVDYVRIPTFSQDTYGFVYSVPKGTPKSAADLALIARCAPILAEYKKRRAIYIGAGKPGIVALLRNWFDNGQGRCSPSFAKC